MVKASFPEIYKKCKILWIHKRYKNNSFYINNLMFDAWSFIWTLDEKAEKIVILPFKTREINIRNEKLIFTDMSYQTFSMSIEEAIYIKE